MGVYISALKLRNISKDGIENIHVNVFDYGINNIKHVSKFEEKVYAVDECGKIWISTAYSFYDMFRDNISIMCNGCLSNNVWENPEKFAKTPFYEFINFTDCDGFFDYVIAEKLYKDFIQYDSLAKKKLAERDLYKYYETYTAILKECIDFKGVIRYT